VIAGVLVGLIIEVLGGSIALAVVIGLIAGVTILVSLAGIRPYREISALQREYRPVFPQSESGEP
jgi:hypothetical protein